MTFVKGRFADDEVHVQMLVGICMQRVHAELRDADLSGLRGSQIRVLTGVPREGISVTDLADRVYMTKQGVGQFVSVLTDLGHLTVAPDVSDRRVRLVRRTPSGDRVVRRFNRAVARVEKKLAAEVGERRYATFRSVLEQLGLETG